MTKIVSPKIRWSPQEGTDGFNVYFAPHVPGPSFDYDSPHVDVGLPAIDANGFHSVFFSEVPELAALPEGSYDFAVTAYDRAGNESDFAEVEQVPLDLTAPTTPANVEVVAG
jgi:hypothetical protein